MLIKQPQVRIVSKQVTLENGELAFAYFALINIAGHVEIKFLGTKPIEATIQAKDEVLLLENVQTQVYGDTKPSYFHTIFSPFFTLDLFANQLARAPSF